MIIERQALLDLEHRLTNDDPDLARFLHELDRPLGQPGAGRVGRAAITTTLVVGAALLFAGLSNVAIALAAAAGMLWLLCQFSDEDEA